MTLFFSGLFIFLNFWTRVDIIPLTQAGTQHFEKAIVEEILQVFLHRQTVILQQMEITLKQSESPETLENKGDVIIYEIRYRGTAERRQIDPL